MGTWNVGTINPSFPREKLSNNILSKSTFPESLTWKYSLIMMSQEEVEGIDLFSITHPAFVYEKLKGG